MMRSRVTLATIEAAAIAALRVSPSTTARCGGASGPEAEAVDEAGLRARREIGENVAQPPEVRAVEPVAVDVARRDDPHRHLRRAVEHGLEQRLAHLRDRPAWSRSAARAAACGARGARRSRAARPRRRAAPRASLGPPRLRRRRSGRRAGGRSGAAAGRSGSAIAPRISRRPGTCSCRVRADRSPAVARCVRTAGRSRRSRRSSVDLPAGVLQRRAIPVAATGSRRCAAQMKTSVSRSMNQAEGCPCSGYARAS